MTAPTTPGTSVGKRALLVLGLVGLLLIVTTLGVLPQLSARLTGDTYRVAVGPVDPIDPFRGAYVDLAYPGLQLEPEWDQEGENQRDWNPPSGRVYLPLETEGDLVVSGPVQTEQPDDGPFLSCDSDGWQVRCGIESWFVPQREAQELEHRANEGDMVAVLKIDSRGNAAVVGLE